jgi:hypothetical protein
MTTRRRPKHRARPRTNARVLDVLENIQEVMLHVLLCSTCPACLGSGRLPDGTTPGPTPDSQPVVKWVVCVCRRQAYELLSEFGMGPGMAEEESVG